MVAEALLPALLVQTSRWDLLGFAGAVGTAHGGHVHHRSGLKAADGAACTTALPLGALPISKGVQDLEESLSAARCS